MEKLGYKFWPAYSKIEYMINWVYIIKRNVWVEVNVMREYLMEQKDQIDITNHIWHL